MHPTVRDDPRLAGQVERYHTWPHLKIQSVAEHSWQVARILLAIYPECDSHLLRAALLHDIGEIGSGDAPYPIKKDNPTLKKIMDGLEEDAHLSMCLPWNLPAPADLSGFDAWVLKLADMLDMFEWGAQELMMGNKFAGLVASRCLTWVNAQIAERTPDPAGDRVCNAVRYYIDRRVATWNLKEII